MTHPIEREVKLRFDDPQSARAAIVACGATPLRRRRLQADALLDAEDESLMRRGCTLRIRTEPGASVLTFKGPRQPGTMKIREEHEAVVADGEALRRIVEQLGFRVCFRYEKYREEFSAPDVTIALDETPVGTFVEIEGSEPGILAVTHALGRTSADFVLDSYHALFVQHREACGLTGSDMVFGPA